MKWKFETSGQSLDVVPVYDHTVQGLVLKPATPSDAKIFRDAQNNALVQWRRRGRINHHWRDRAGVPVSEESEYYEIEAYNGSTLVQTYRVPSNLAQPVQWDAIAFPSLLLISSDGSGTIYRTSTATSDTAVAVSKQKIDGPFVFEFEVFTNPASSLPAGTFILPTLDVLSADINAGNGLFSGSGLAVAAVTTFNAYGGAGTSTVSAVPGDRFAIEYQGGVTRVFKNPSSSSSQPFKIASVSATYAPYVIYAAFTYGSGGLQAIRNPQLLRLTTPDWTYTADMQTADGLTPGSAIHLKIYQVSAVTGRGSPLDVTL